MQTTRRSHRFVSLILAAVISGPAVCCLRASSVTAQSHPTAPAETFPFVGEVKGKDVSVRAGPSVHFRRLGRLSKPKRVTVLGRSYGWYKIRLPEEAEAYVAAAFLDDSGGQTAQVKVDTLNVRGGPGTTYGLLGQLKKGDEVTVLERRPDGWVKIAPLESWHAWMAADYVRWVKPGTESKATASLSSHKGTIKQKVSDNKPLPASPPALSDNSKSRRIATGRLIVVEHLKEGWAEARLDSANGEEWILFIPSFAADVFNQTEVKVEAVPCSEGFSARFSHKADSLQNGACLRRIEWML